MKTLPLLLIALSIPLDAAVPTAEIAPELRPLFDTLVTDEAPSLVGKEFTIPLRLKHVSEKFLVFSNAYIELDRETKYQIGKWKFDSSVIAPYYGKKNIIVLITFRIDQIQKEDRKMPFFEASILSISEIKENAE